MPDWVETGYQEYAKRLPPECALHLVEIEPGHRGKGASVEIARREEGGRLLAALPKGVQVIALDERGDSPTSERFAEMLGEARDRGTPNTVLMIGGPDGHGQELLSRAGHRISFGRLTWPHQIVRILAAEQVYRAVTILSGHPYHRS